MSEPRKFRRSDIIVLLSYPLLPMVYFAAAAMGAGTGIPSRLSSLAIVAFFSAATCLVVLPVWTMINIARSKEQFSLAAIVGEAVLAALWISTGIYAALVDSLRAFIALVVAAWAGALVFIMLRVRAQQAQSAPDFLPDQANPANPTASN